MGNHPDLTRKLKLLYRLQLNRNINSHTDLAAASGITKQAVSRWIHGSDTRHGNHIPVSQVRHVARLFQIQEHWLALPYAEFETHLFDMLDAASECTSLRPDKISISQLPATASEIFGRGRELDMLDAAWADEHTNIVQLVAFGGVGKSSLVNHWLARLNTQNYAGARQVYAWSFYWQGAAADIRSAGDFFIEHALDWFGDPAPANGTPWAKASRLANLIRQSRTLLILDGLEPLQYPPGPKFGHIENPAVAFLIKELAAENTGLCVITTRLPVSDLNAYGDERIQTHQLGHLSVKAAVALLKNQAITGSRSAIQDAVQKYSCHPLSLTLLGGYLKIAYEGEIRHAHRLRSLFEEVGQSSHATNIMRAYLDWFADSPECELLYLIGLLDRTTTFDELKTIASYGVVPGLTAGLRTLNHLQWSFAIQRLSDARLVAVQESAVARVIDCHPLVKEYAVMQLKNTDNAGWRAGNGLLFRYYQQGVPEYPEAFTDLDNLFRAVIHGARAGLHQDAFELYFFRIKNGYTMLSRGSHFTDQACLRTFFAEPWTTPVAGLTEEQQIHLYSSLAANQMSLGNIQAAIAPAEKSLQWFVQNQRWLEATTFAGPYISMLIAVGRLHDVHEVMGALDPFVENAQNQVLAAMGLIFHAYVDYLRGDNHSAQQRFATADQVLTLPAPDASVPFPTISSYYCKFLLETGRLDAALERSLKTFGWRERKAWQVSIDTPSLYASDLLVLGMVFMARGDLVNARKYLDQQVEIFRAADEWLYLPTGLHSRARYFIRVRDIEAAIADLDEALHIARRTGAVFGEWESYLSFAHLYYTLQDVDQCRRYLDKARALPAMHRYKFRDVEIAELDAYIAAAANDSAGIDAQSELPAWRK